MTAHTVSVQLPRPIFLRLKDVAELTHRSVEEVLVTTVDAALPEHRDLPAGLANELTAMNLLSDEALWAATEPSLSPTEQRRLSQLNHSAEDRPLTKAERAEQEQLLFAYHRSILRRAKALAILTQRGHPLPEQAESRVAFDELP
jgi:hypothetical protein